MKKGTSLLIDGKQWTVIGTRYSALKRVTLIVLQDEKGKKMEIDPKAQPEMAAAVEKAPIMEGVPGKDAPVPQRGVHYWTKADIDQITKEATAVLKASFRQPLDGEDGKPGEPGKPGENGKTPKAGIDYPTKAEMLRFVVSEVSKIPKLEGTPGKDGKVPAHKWEGTKLFFQNPDGKWGEGIDLKGRPGDGGDMMGGSGGAPFIGQVKTTVSDETPGFLGDKLKAGSNVTITEITENGVKKYQISSTGGSGGGSGIVETIVAGNNVDVDATDPANPIVSVETLTLADISDVTATVTEVNYIDGVTSAIQTQLDAKLDDSQLDTDGTLSADSDVKVATQKATKTYVDAVAQGLSIKESVKVATAAALPANTYSNGASGVGATLTAVATGVLTIDGVSVALTDRILVKDEVTGANNGIYVCTVAGAIGVAYVLTRSTSFDSGTEISGAFTFVEEGSTNADNGYVCITNDPITVGTTALSFTQFSGAGQITAGDALTKTGNTLDVAVDNSSIEVSGDALRVKALGITSAMLAGSIDATKLADGSVTSTELQYIGGLTSDAQTQLDGKASKSGALTQFVGNGNHKVFYSDGSGDVTELALGADGTFLKSNGASSAPSFATPSGGGMTWSEVTGTTQSMSVNNGYISNNASLVVFTLPDTAALGSIVRVTGKGAGGWKIAQNASEQIIWNEGGVDGTNETTVGTGGYLASTDDYDSIELVCLTADTTWGVLSVKGNITLN